MRRDTTMSRQAMKAELLDAETELKLAYAWRDERDEAGPASIDHGLHAPRDLDGGQVQALWRADERPDSGSRSGPDESG